MFVISIIYFQSPLSKIDEIHIVGNQFIPAEEIVKQSNLSNKNVVFNLNKDEIKERLKEFSEIKDVDVRFNFPNDVTIKIEEYDQIGYIITEDKIKSLLENGQITNYINKNLDQIGPVIVNFTDEKILALLVEQLNILPEEIRHSISEIIYSPKKTDKYYIVAFMNDGFEVHATLRTFAEKMSYYPALIKQLNPEEKGIIDLEVGLFYKSYESLLHDKEKSDDMNESEDERAE